MQTEMIAVLAVAFTISSVLATLIEVYVLKLYRRPGSLEQRINSLAKALKESSRLVGEVEGEIASRKKLVQELQQDAERYQTLVALNSEQVEAVAQTLQGELRKEGRKAFWGGVAANFAFFTIGALLSWYFATQ